MNAGDFAAIAMTLYVAHHIGDYWVQTDRDEQHKGDAGASGRMHCFAHVGSYVLTQSLGLLLLAWVTGLAMPYAWIGLLVSGVTHYTADRREHGLMFWLARRMPWKAPFLKFGVPRAPQHEEVWGPCPTCEGRGTSYDASTGGMCWDCRGGGVLPGVVILTDNPSLGTGAWALDQSWHIFFGVFVPALLIVGLS